MNKRGQFALETEELSLWRAGTQVLHSVTVSFERRAVTAVVGPSGSGKTSLLRCLNRLEEADGGRVLLDGVDVRTLEPTILRQRVGMISQQPVLFEGGVRANLTYGLEDVGRADLEESMHAAGLPLSVLERDSTALSVGQAQRVTIARALVRNPTVLLMDEPTSALDKDAAARIEGLIGDLIGRGLTVVLVTHDLRQARRVADRGVLLVGGCMEAAGKLDQIEASWPDHREGDARA
jgi:ABC-type phosphate transport system ATPase subunit